MSQSIKDLDSSTKVDSTCNSYWFNEILIQAHIYAIKLVNFLALELIHHVIKRWSVATGFLQTLLQNKLFLSHILENYIIKGYTYHPPSHLLPEAFHHTLKWWKSSGCLWTSHQPSLKLSTGITLFLTHLRKRIDGWLRWYV